MKIMPYFKGNLLATWTSIALAIGLATPAYADIQAIGWIEHVKIASSDIIFNAKIDTGADNSSIDARNIKIYSDNSGHQRVKFSIENLEGNRSEFNLPLVRMANIKRKGASNLKRPVVSMNLCIGNTLKTVDVNLANRKNFKYRMLVGRTYLKNVYLVDTNRKYTAEPVCNNDKLAANQ